MRSNGLVHLANNTFFGVASDEPRCAFLHTEGLPTPTSQLPVNRPYPFDIRTEVDSSYERHLNTVDSNNNTGKDVATTSNLNKSKPVSEHRHVCHGSVDGKYVALIASASHHHGLIDVARGHVTNFTVERDVLGVAWHPGCSEYPHSAAYLCLLLEGGVVCILDAATTSRGVDVACVSVLQCSALIHKLLNDTTCTIPSEKMITLTSGKLLSSVCRTTMSPAHVPPTAETDLVSMTFTHETLGLPTMLLLLSRRGDVYSVKLDDATMQPVPDALTAARFSEEDGRYLRMVDGSPRRRGDQQQPLPSLTTGGAPLCVHHVVRPKADVDCEAVAFTSTLVERREGVFVVAVLYSSGTLKLYRVGEKDLLAVDSRLSRYYAQLPLLPSALFVTSSSVKRLAQCVHVAQQGSLLLYRFPGNHVFLVSLPVCLHHHHGTSEWVHLTGTTRDTATTLPTVSGKRHDLPQPLAVRLPFRLEGYSLAMSYDRILGFPERVRGAHIPLKETDRDGKETTSILTLPLLSLRVEWMLKSAMYSTIGTVTPSVGLHASSSLAALMDRLCDCHALLMGEVRNDVEFNNLSSVNPLKELHALVEMHSTSVADGVTKELNRVQELKAIVSKRETALEQRLATLKARVSTSSQKVENLTDFLRDATVGRQGPAAVHSLNQTLGKIHDVLKRLETDLEISVK